MPRQAGSCSSCQTLGVVRKVAVDSMILFFGGATQSQVEEAAGRLGFTNGTVTRGSESFHLHRYGAEDQLAEQTEDELNKLSAALGTGPSCAFQVSARHGQAARLALEVVAQLMSKLPPAVLDDDFGHLWSSSQVSKLLGDRPEQGIYALRDA